MSAVPDPPVVDAVSSRVVEIPFTLQSTAPVAGTQPVCGGLCVPRGLLKDAESASVTTGKTMHRAQADILSRWSDGSVRWVLLSWIAPPMDVKRECTARFGHSIENTPGPSTVRLQRHGRRISIQQQDADSAPVQFTEVDVVPLLIDRNGHDANFIFGEIATEVSGPVRSVYRLSGTLVQDSHISLQLRFEVWAECGLVRIESRLRNCRRARHKGGLWDLGDPGSFRFSGLHLHTVLQCSVSTVIRWKPEANAEVRQQSGDENLQITQGGSGGAAWSNSNHVGADNKSTVRQRGYEAAAAGGTVRGYRANPIVCIEADDSQLSVTMPEFWQRFPSSLAVDNGVLSVGLFPASTDSEFELQGGEQSTARVWLATGPAGPALDALCWAAAPAAILQSPEWIQRCRVFDWFAGDLRHIDENTKQRYQSWLHDVSTGVCSVDARREAIDEYGWRNYGDVHADHEQTHYTGTNTIISHYNNQFDLIYGGIVNQYVCGDVAWRNLFAPLAHHVMDIDIYHTDEDRAAFNGGLFWHTDHYVDARSATHRTYSKYNTPPGDDYGGGPGNEHNYTTGLLSYYYLTGNPEAADSVVSLADWVFGLDDGSGTIFALLDDGPTGSATATVTDDYHGPGRGSGNSINALLDGWEVSHEERYLRKAEELIRRVAHPEQNLDGLNLLDAEYRWSYTVCLTALGRYLHKMDEADRRGPMYDYVRRTLRHYGVWMLEHERPTLSAPENLEFVTEAWAAQEFRKANVLRIAASCCDDTQLAVCMREKADDLNDAAWSGLYSFGEKHLTTRCWSIVMTEGLRDVFHRTHRQYRIPAAAESRIPGDWEMFVPQRARVKQLLKSPKHLLRALPRLLSISRWCQTIDAFRRRR